ncbi:MAG: CapA family protein [Actinomycetota bacterium]|nr:CapA family protein [Actinomycetota bacterium]
MKKKTLIATSLTLAAGVLLLLLVQDSRRGNDDVDNLPSESGIPGESSEDVGAGKKTNPEPSATSVPTPEATPVPTPEATPVPTPEPTPTPNPPMPQKATLVFTGDILSHGPVIQRAAYNGGASAAHDYIPMFSQVRPLLEQVDLAICHLETPVSSDNLSLSGYPIFNAPQELPANLKTVGYDGCSTASNHSMDKGANGVRSTITQLQNAGLVWSGMARSVSEQRTPALYSSNGILIGHMSYTYGLNGFVLPSGEPYLVNVIDEDKILDEARRMRSAGVDFVILSVQWGNEYQVNPSAAQKELAESLLGSSSIDLIVGSHVHVVQPIGKFNEKYVIYGLGNFLSNQSANCCPAASQNGVMVFVDIVGTEEDGFQVQNLTFEPTRVDRSDYTIVPLSRAVRDEDLDQALQSFYQEVIDDTSSVINQLGGNYQIRESEGTG